MFVTFEDKSKRTTFVEGPYPQFNQTLEIEFIPDNNDFSPQALKMVDKSLYFNIFDVVTLDNTKDAREHNTISQRNEYRWLGSYSIPFSTIYQNTKVSLFFKSL